MKKRRTQEQKRKLASESLIERFHIHYTFASGTTKIEVSKDIWEQYQSLCKSYGRMATKFEFENFIKSI